MSGSSSSSFMGTPHIQVIPCPAPPHVTSAILDLELQVFGKEAWGPKDVSDELSKVSTLLICAYVEEEHTNSHPEIVTERSQQEQQHLKPNLCLVGYILGGLNSVNCHCLRLGVTKAHRRKGLGLALIQGLLCAARHHHVFGSSLIVAINNTPARMLYARAGYKEDASLEDYYGRGKHAVRMQTELASDEY